jgi:hypothetical protein
LTADDTSDVGEVAIREIDSAINPDGARSECVNAQGDGVPECWDVGPYPLDHVTTPGSNGLSKVFINARNSLENNLLVNRTGS